MPLTQGMLPPEHPKAGAAKAFEDDRLLHGMKKAPSRLRAEGELKVSGSCDWAPLWGRKAPPLGGAR